MLARRGFLMGLGSLVAAPAIVRAASLMPVKAIVVPAKHEFIFRTSLPHTTWRMLNSGDLCFKPNAVAGDIFSLMTQFMREKGEFDGLVTDYPLSSHYDLVTQND